MLGEGLTTGAPVQQMRFDESAFDVPTGRGRHIALRMSLGVVLALVAVIIL